MAKQQTAAANAKASTRKRTVKVEATGEAHISATFNNIIISLTNINGQVISWSSAGKMGFRGSKKNTPYAAQMAAENCAKEAHDFGLRKVKVYVKFLQYCVKNCQYLHLHFLFSFLFRKTKKQENYTFRSFDI